MSDNIKLNSTDHWQEIEINLRRPCNDNKLWGFTIAGGIDIPFVNHHFKSIIVTNITENSPAYEEQHLKLYDIILRVNQYDLQNSEHQIAVNLLRTAGSTVQLLVRRLAPSICEEIELKHDDGKLDISIGGGIGSAYFPYDHGIFIAEIDKKQTNKQLNVGDRLLRISSADKVYDLRFVTHATARKCIELACAESKTIKLYVGHTRPVEEIQEETVGSHQGQYDLHDSEDEDSAQGNRNEQQLIMSFDRNDYQRYENRGKVPKNRLLNRRSIGGSTGFLTVDEEQSHAARFAPTARVVDSKADRKNWFASPWMCVNDFYMNVASDRRVAQQLELKEAAMPDAYEERLRRHQSEMSQRARTNTDGAIHGSSEV